MANKKAPSKTTTHRAAKVLSNPKASKAAKSSAGRTLAKASSATRTVKSAPKSGSVGRAATKRAISRVTSSSKTRKK